jgi:hypothetical protein
MNGGALTKDELLALWASSVDKSYSDPIVAAGDGHGLEAFGQMAAQAARVSSAIDTSMQAMYIRPWSGQSSPPAGGAQAASVDLTFTRTGYSTGPILLAAGFVFFEEQQIDWGTDGGEAYNTGRRYTLVDDYVIEPGDSGPIVLRAVAEEPGYGYNNPLPGTIKIIDQPGAGFYHDGASVVVTPAAFTPLDSGPSSPYTRATLTAANVPDMFVPEHVGQYVLFTAGSNAGRAARIVSFAGPNAALNVGSSVGLELAFSIESFAPHPTLVIGELLFITDNVFSALFGYAQLIGAEIVGGNTKLTFVLLSGTVPALNLVVQGMQSNALVTADVQTSRADFVNETGTASWRILDWTLDVGLAVTNELSPTGGRLAMLDELGSERAIYRAANEDDESYRDRVATIADVVTPNAIRRTLNKSLGGVPWCLRETGTPRYPGFYLDHDAWDYTMTRITGAITGTFQDREPVRQIVNGVIASGIARTQRAAAPSVPGPPGAETFAGFVQTGRTPFVAGQPIVGLRSGATVTPGAITQSPQNRDRFKLVMGYLEFRAYMFIGVAPTGVGEFGFAFDAGPTNAFDAAPYNDFFDGVPFSEGYTDLKVFQAIDKVRAGGVGYELYVEPGPCP